MLKLTDKLEEIYELLNKEVRNAEQVAMHELLGLYLRRIFNEGKATDNELIGLYSTKPMLTGSKNFINQGRAQSFFKKKNEWKTIKTPKGKQALALIPGGYKEFRQLNGFQSDKVDLEFRGDLFRSIVVSEFNGNIVLGFSSLKEATLSKNLEAKYKKAIFTPTQNEIKIAEETFNDYLKEKIQELFDKW